MFLIEACVEWTQHDPMQPAALTAGVAFLGALVVGTPVCLVRPQAGGATTEHASLQSLNEPIECVRAGKHQCPAVGHTLDIQIPNRRVCYVHLGCGRSVGAVDLSAMFIGGRTTLVPFRTVHEHRWAFEHTPLGVHIATVRITRTIERI